MGKDRRAMRKAEEGRTFFQRGDGKKMMFRAEHRSKQDLRDLYGT